MKAYFRLIILLLLLTAGILSACDREGGGPTMSPYAAAPAAQTVTITEYSPRLPFTTSVKPYSVLECSYSVLSQGGGEWDFGWTLTIHNNTTAKLPINATVQLLYDTGYQVAAYEIPGVITLDSGSEETLTGHLMVNAQDARQVKSITALIRA